MSPQWFWSKLLPDGWNPADGATQLTEEQAHRGRSQLQVQCMSTWGFSISRNGTLFFFSSLLFPLPGIWSPILITAPTRTSVFTCFPTKGGRVEGKLTPSRGTWTPSMTRRESSSCFPLCLAGWLWVPNLLMLTEVSAQVWVHRLPHGAPPTNPGCGCKERWRSALQTQRPTGEGRHLLVCLFYTKSYLVCLESAIQCNFLRFRAFSPQ